MAKSRRYLTRQREIEKCTTKVRYYDLREAQQAAARFRSSTGWSWRVYRCPGLKGEQRHFHLTSGQRF